MSGDPSKASVWRDGDVYWSADPEADIPADVDTPFGVDWDLVGLLDGDEGFTWGRDEQVDDKFAWGGVLVRTIRSQFKQTVGFTALEDNDTTSQLIWPGSTTGNLVVPRPTRGRVAFETREGSVIRRRISAYQAEVVIDGEIKDTETDLTRYALVATIFPDASFDPPLLFIEQKSEEGS